VTEPDPAVYLVTVQNNDSSACDSQSFDLSALIAGPSVLALGSSFTPSSLTVAPQSSLSTNLTVTPTASPADGVHTITATATKSDDLASSDSAAAGLTILVPSVTLSLSVSGVGTITVQETSQQCSGSCAFSYPEAGWGGLNLTTSTTHKKQIFCAWTGDCNTPDNNTSGTCSLPDLADHTVGATFANKCGGGGGNGGGGNGGGNGGGGNGKGGGKPT
jgi:hypothetical protein